MWDSDSDKYAIELAETVDAILFGRVTYELLANYWPTASPPTDSPIMIDKMNNLPKVVFSKTLSSAGWNNTRIVKGNIAEEVSRLKQQPGKNIVIYGSMGAGASCPP